MLQKDNNKDSNFTAQAPFPVLATSISTQMHTNISPIQIPRPAVHFRDSTLSSNLASKLAGDIICACTITFGFSPFVTVIDKAIIQKAAGTHGILQSSLNSIVNIARNPGNYVKSPMFLIMWGVYASTYCTVNCLKTIMEHRDHFKEPDALGSSNDAEKFGVFAATTAINSGASMLKDKFYATHFGNATAASTVPKITYGLWGLRDCMVIGSSFILPDLFCGVLTRNTEMDRKTALTVSQLSCPIAAQFVAGPVQLLGLDIYNRPLRNLSFGAAVIERLRFQRTNFTSIVGARISRIAPAYGIGGVGNTYLRDKWRDQLLRKEMQRNWQSKSQLTMGSARRTTISI
eukprot:CAMPEP_0194443350 /NCGR_PEP_ID=MMETSP0176-20130528/126652_1 /TAXON_ID=216777 /ORGANISM="Proboscia alata, Strain PI-D3" /LENGTH=345 /DNA_ID=CAMNT_0039269579 /DNA_START=82 /DNA_END=1119 /DNA_ORIENTATION=-